MGADATSFVSKPMDVLLPMASRIFLQTHVLPMLLKDGQVNEIRLQLINSAGIKIPVYVNCQNTTQGDIDSYTWIFYVTMERSRFEEELLQARKKAEDLFFESIERERFIRTVTDGLPSLVGYWDKNLICRFANAEYVKWFGKSTSDILGIHIKVLLGEQLYLRNLPHIEGALAGEPQEFEREIKRTDGSLGYTLANYLPDKDSSGAVNGFFALVTNISALREADAAIRLAASVFEVTSEGIMVTDASLTILSVNQAFTRLTGYAAADAVGKNASLFKSARHSDEFFRDLYKALKKTGKWKGEVWSKRKDNSDFLEALSISAIRNDIGEITKYVGVFDDVTQRWDKEQMMQHMAFHDGLTGLPNRLLFMERLNRLISIAKREVRQIALLFLDLDGFKLVNDTYGHEIGDFVLQAVANRLSSELRDSDTVARFGGDEFVVLLDNPDSHDNVAIIASRLIEVVNIPIQVGIHELNVGTSIGIGMLQNNDQTAEQLLKLADDAMYDAKKSGKNTFLFSATLT